jgi:IS30 family transposase
MSYRAIAEKFSIHHTTVGRELRRNREESRYGPLVAQTQAQKRRECVSTSAKIFTPELKALIIKLLQQDFSPVPISGRLRKTGEASISHENFDRLIWKDKKQGGNLYIHLRHRVQKYHKRGAKNAGRGCIPGRVDMDERPQVVEKKVRLGDWEGDCVIGTQSRPLSGALAC